MPIRSLRRLTHLRDWLVPFALVLLLLSQSIALAHRIVHAPGTVASTSRDTAGLFGDHSANECRLFDQLAPTDLAPVPVLALSFALDSFPAPVAEQAVPITARLRAFRARDPPASLA
jgi:hypothetical protein